MRTGIYTHDFYKEVTPLAGIASLIVPTNMGICSAFAIKPLTGTTTYDFKITEHNGIIWRDTTVSPGGQYSEEDTHIPSNGNWTVDITSASVDELFIVVFYFEQI